MIIEIPKFRTAYNYDRDQASDETGLTCPEPTLTSQDELEESDINTIAKNFGLSGILPTGVRMPTYEDFTQVKDFHTAAIAMAQAKEAFEQMPADVRTRFQNDPQQFVEFCSDANNRLEAEKLGLVKPAPATEPTPKEPTQQQVNT